MVRDRGKNPIAWPELPSAPAWARIKPWSPDNRYHAVHDRHHLMPAGDWLAPPCRRTIIQDASSTPQIAVHRKYVRGGTYGGTYAEYKQKCILKQ